MIRKASPTSLSDRPCRYGAHRASRKDCAPIAEARGGGLALGSAILEDDRARIGIARPKASSPIVESCLEPPHEPLELAQ